ncbi:hypothetical protein DPMN_165569 [Dreissena polymorpha]|uniref:Uncharacterized protein n=1 Tax=Dreissena polymorpha TaxID=45954 RepID=A0A9D4IUQ4_DREPO|nr:hypothetical protein DPMN_165569 [Dreissena polymorpha]
MKHELNLDTSVSMGNSLTSSALSFEPGCLTDPPISQYDAPTPLLDEHYEEEEFNDWLGSLAAPEDHDTAPPEGPNLQVVPTLTSAEQRETMNPMTLIATSEQVVVFSPIMTAPQVTTAVVQDPIIEAMRQSTEMVMVFSPMMAAPQVTTSVVQDVISEAIRQSTIQVVNTIREGHSSILSATYANPRDMVNLLKEIRDALQKTNNELK